MIVIADTSVVLNLCRIGAAALLDELYGEVIIPDIVAQEFSRLSREHPRFAGLSLPAFVLVRESPSLLPPVIAQAQLDAGEKAAIALALATADSLLLIDEAQGRALAVELGLTTIGVLGILLEAKMRRLIPLLAPLLDQLANDAGFWIAPEVRSRVLKLAGE